MMDDPYNDHAGVYTTDTRGQETAEFSTAAGRVTKLVLPLWPELPNQRYTTGVSQGELCKALALHELTHVRMAEFNHGEENDQRMGVGIPRAYYENLPATIAGMRDLIPAADAVGGSANDPLRAHVGRRFDYIMTEATRTFDSGVVAEVPDATNRVRASLELPTVVAELTVFLAAAIAHEPALEERWQPLIDQVRANHQVFLEASTND